jgi:hypothetical protein
VAGGVHDQVHDYVHVYVHVVDCERLSVPSAAFLHKL